MHVAISDIKIKKRIRQDNGNIDSLADSLDRHGLFNPILLTQNYELIGGFRRLQAAKLLGWETIPATIVETSDKVTRLELELEENVQRLNFTEEELFEGLTKLEKMKKVGIFKRLWYKIREFFTHAFDSQVARKSEKRRKNGLLSLLLPGGIALAVFSGYLYTGEYISAIFLSLLNIFSFCAGIIGLFFFIRFCRGFKK